MLKLLIMATVGMLLASPRAQPQDAGPPAVDAQRRVTFRLEAPNAQKVMLIIDSAKPLEMQRDEGGAWSHTTGALEPDFYNYYFVVDGARQPDPGNPAAKPVISGGHESILHVPGPASLLWEQGNVPRGQIHRHTYRSEIAGEQRELLIYTPPAYDAAGDEKYPVLYLLHGVADGGGAWTTAGRANVILDNLIAHGQAKPMLLVMPLGYGFADPAHNLQRAFAGPIQQGEIMKSFDRMMLGEIIPLVEAEYRVKSERESRAIAGLSMGGAQALYIGLNHPDRFAWIGSFSGAFVLYGSEYDGWFPNIQNGIDPPPRLIWQAIGTEDFLLYSNRRLGEWLKAKGVSLTSVEAPGAHTWGMWRRNLGTFAPLLFRAEPAQP